MKQLLIIFEKYESKFILLEDGEVVEIFIERERSKNIIGNIYKGKIIDILDGLESIFVDIGENKKAFLHTKNKKIKNSLKKDDEILVQVETFAREEKGAKLTLDYSIQGKYLVLLPNAEKISISKKIKDKINRDRLEKIFENIEEIKKLKTGLIIRTKAENIESELLLKEYNSLFLKWEKIKNKFSNSKVGEILYSDNNLFQKFLENDFIENIDEIIVNNEKSLEKINKFILEKKKEKKIFEKIRKYTKDENILEYYGVNLSIEKALNNKVWLDCGGYIIIEKTEALISIDVNTGQNIGNKNFEQTFEQTILETNIEAAIEIAKQLRLRNLAGIIIIDFIDMKSHKNREKVLKVLEENLKKDRVETRIVHFSKLGLVEMTRKRENNSLETFYKQKCDFCEGSGKIISEDTVILKILSEIKNLICEKDINIIEIISEEKIIKKIKKEFLIYLESILKDKKEIKFEIDNEFREFRKERYKINLYK